MSYHHLTMAERNVIRNLQMFGQSQAKIARCLGYSATRFVSGTYVLSSCHS